MNIEELEYSESEFVKSWVEDNLYFYEFDFKPKNYGGGKHWVMVDETGFILSWVSFE